MPIIYALRDWKFWAAIGLVSFVGIGFISVIEGLLAQLSSSIAVQQKYYVEEKSRLMRMCLDDGRKEYECISIVREAMR